MIVRLIPVTGSVQVLLEEAVAVVAAVTVHVIAVLAGAYPHEVRLNRTASSGKAMQSLAAQRVGTPDLDPVDGANVWLNLDPAPLNARYLRNLSGHNPTSTNPQFNPSGHEGVFSNTGCRATRWRRCGCCPYSPWRTPASGL